MPVTMTLLLLLGGPQQGAAADSQAQRGVVRDQTGAVLQGAQVELPDESGGTVRTLSTDGKGEFLIDRIPPGPYTLKVRFEGFRAATVRVRVVARRTPAPQVVVLELASQTQEITVNAAERRPTRAPQRIISTWPSP
jgi:hypothetical protein